GKTTYGRNLHDFCARRNATNLVPKRNGRVVSDPAATNSTLTVSLRDGTLLFTFEHGLGRETGTYFPGPSCSPQSAPARKSVSSPSSPARHRRPSSGSLASIPA